MALLRAACPVIFQNPIDDRGKRIQLRSPRRLAPPVSRRHRKYHHLRHRPWVDPKSPTRLTMAQTLDLNRMAYTPMEFHALHPSAFHPSGKRLSAAAILLRRNRTTRPLQ
jgi:hypothetical protein